MQGIRVLILIDEHVMELSLIERAHVVKPFQQFHRFQNDVVKVQRVRLVQPRLILGVDLRDLLHAVIARDGGRLVKLRRGLHLVLGPADDGEGQPRRECLFIHLKIAQHVLDDALGVCRVVDREAGRVALQPVDVPPQNAAAGRVERHRPDVEGLRPQHAFEPLLQLVGRLVCKRDRDDRPRRGGMQRRERLGPLLHGLVARLEIGFEKFDVLIRDIVRDLIRIRRLAERDEVRDAVDEHGRLAAARAGQQQQRPLRGHDRAALHLVQARKTPGDDRTACR